MKYNCFKFGYFQEIFQLYNRREVKATTNITKLFLFILIGFQFFELMCYLILFQYLSQHNREMADNNIISADLHKSRKSINIFSLKAQVCGFITEAIFLIFTLITKLLERRHFVPNSREYGNTGVLILFCTNSTVQILASAELRKKFYALFRR